MATIRINFETTQSQFGFKTKDNLLRFWIV